MEDRWLSVDEIGTCLGVKPNAVLLNGTGRGTIGRAAPCRQQSEAIPDNHVTILRSPDLDPVCISLYLSNVSHQPSEIMYQRRTSGQLEIYPFDIKKFLIWGTPKELQQKIRSLHDRAFATECKSKELLGQAESGVEQQIVEAVRL